MLVVLSTFFLLSQGLNLSVKDRLALSSSEYVITPFGYRPKQCVLTPEEENHVIEVVPNNGGTWVVYPDSNRRVFHPPLPECIANAQILQKKIEERRLKAKLNKNTQDKNPLGNLGDGWQIYGGWYPPDLMGYFTVDMTLPNEDMTDVGQIMYYFIGMQNNDQPAQVTIIQPVITYCQNGCSSTEQGSTLPGWSGNSWNCCPSGQTWFATPIQLQKGQSGVFGSVYSDDNAGTVTVITSDGTAKSNLTLEQDTRKYDWVDVTLEAYDYGRSCDAFNDLPFLFSNMTLTSADNTDYDNPKWTVTNNGICQGSITFTANGLSASIIGDGEK